MHFFIDELILCKPSERDLLVTKLTFCRKKAIKFYYVIAFHAVVDVIFQYHKLLFESFFHSFLLHVCI